MHGTSVLCIEQYANTRAGHGSKVGETDCTLMTLVAPREALSGDRGSLAALTAGMRTSLSLAGASALFRAHRTIVRP